MLGYYSKLLGSHRFLFLDLILAKQTTDRSDLKPSGRLAAREEGSILMIVAIVFVSLLGFSGLAIDFGYYFVQKTRLQSLVDASALACGYEGCVPSTAAEAKNAVLLNPVNTYGVPVRVEAFPPQVDLNLDCPANVCYRVSATVEWDTFFIRLFGIPKLGLTVSATATSGSADQIIPAIQALGPGGILFRTGSKSSVDIDGPLVSAGSISNAPAGSTTNPNSSLPNACEALDQFVPPPTQFNTCNFTNFNFSPTNNACNATPTMQPGTYCGTLRIDVRNNCRVVLEKGNYFVQGNIEIITGATNSSVVSRAGGGVFIYNRTGNFDLSDSKGVVSLSAYSAPRTSDVDFSGVVYWQDNASALVFKGSNQGINLTLDGIVYAPQTDLVVDNESNNNNNDTFAFGSLIADSIELDMLSGALAVGPPPDTSVCVTENAGKTALIR